MKKILYFFCFILVVCGCNKTDNSTEDNQPGAWYTTFTGNYMDSFIKPDGLRLFYTKSGDNECFIKMNFDCTLDEYSYHAYKGEESVSKYKKYAQYYGDTTYTEKHDNSETEIGSRIPLNSINIIADCDFDKEHPAGTSLNDIFTLKYLALYSFIKDGYKNRNEGERNTYPEDSISVIANFKGASLFSCNTALFFKKVPAPGKYTFTVTLDFGNDPLTGEKVTVPPANIEIEF